MDPEPLRVGRMTAPDLKGRLDAGEPLTILDVREDNEREFCAIRVPTISGITDLHVPMSQLARRVDEINMVGQAAPIVVYCHLGQRSLAVARWLMGLGLREIYNLDGGIDAWSEVCDPTVPRY
jgi:rhodanese-related sulfurtransferase